MSHGVTRRRSGTLLASVAGALAVVVVLLMGGGRAQAADLCGEALCVAQPEAPPDDPLSALAAGVWSHVYGVYFAATGRSTEFHVLGPEANLADGKPFPPHAFICSAPPTQGSTAPGIPKLFVTWPLVELADRDKLYDVDFLALVIGHELGHRSGDFDWEGRLTTKQGSTAIEARADLRGAFFAAAGGYSTRRVACDAALDLFLNIEAGVSASARAERKAKLAEALAAFDVYESLYDAASAWVFWDSTEAEKLLAWIDEHLTKQATPIPEFKILLAQALMTNAIDDGPWASRARPTDLIPSSPCVPIFAEHTAFWDQVADPIAKPGDPSRDAAEKLQRAAKLLQQAEAEGASALVTSGTLACVHAYLGDTKAAKRQLDRATGLVPATASAALGHAIAADRAFVAWLDWMDQNPAPPESAKPADRAGWGKRLQSAKAAFAANATITAWIGRLRGFPNHPPAPANASVVEVGAPVCEKSKAVGGMTRVPPMPPIPRSGGCPCGWTELHFLPDHGEKAPAGSGVRTCVPAGWAVGMRYVELGLLFWYPAKLSMETFSRRLMSIDRPDGALANLQTWRERCGQAGLAFRSVSERGVRLYAGNCPALGASAVVIAADQCRVVRATMFPTQ